jgi:hypothetical protein
MYVLGSSEAGKKQVGLKIKPYSDSDIAKTTLS